MDLLSYLNISVVSKNKKQVELVMPISDYHKQPFGIMHGGMNGVLIETACSIGALEHLDPPKVVAVGIDLQVNHLKSVTQGELRILATPIHIGKQTQVWQADIYQEEQLTSTGRCTLLNKVLS
ncbi:PaaI family thioesterase [Vagococcus xieshaowenii]|uniref:PaaI family thioesterase n=1 Tax=Vagococcus xieshaowenii TaxID=2562451 RepID=A0AAJ5EF97_9ENTE|nr:PaaI family thioesterase [Vagococcus xieshaowenii]QCA28212.1 PaaI family thioesterase [Vagococcus xieshaowenii]TFZ42564.1 PaaI family thioesterase [Vagococcus xieshaowenii]